MCVLCVRCYFFLPNSFLNSSAKNLANCLILFSFSWPARGCQLLCRRAPLPNVADSGGGPVVYTFELCRMSLLLLHRRHSSHSRMDTPYDPMKRRAPQQLPSVLAAVPR